jgi:hypothetical protein
MKVNANEKHWNATILVIYIKIWHEKPWKVTNLQAKNPVFRVKPETLYLCNYQLYKRSMNTVENNKINNVFSNLHPSVISWGVDCHKHVWL